MVNLAAQLHEAISAVCPIDGVSIGKAGDRSSWRVHPRPDANDAQKAEAAAVIARFTPTADEPAAPVGGGLVVAVRGKSHVLADSDALKLVGALAMAVDGETAHVTLASGDVLELTHQDVSDIGRQLAGKPADEVSG